MDIKWDDDWEEKILRAAQPALEQFAREHQPRLDDLAEQYKGHPVEQIKPIVDSELRRWGGSIDGDAELTRIATAISEGQRVILRPPA